MIAAQDAARLNTPDWLWQRWSETYGEEATRAIASVHLGVPPLDIVSKNSRPFRMRHICSAMFIGMAIMRALKRYRVLVKGNGGCRMPPQPCP